MTHCNEYLQVKMYGIKGIFCDLLCHTTVPMMIFFFKFYLILLGGAGGYKSRKQIRRDKEMKGIGMHDIKSTESK